MSGKNIQYWRNKFTSRYLSWSEEERNFPSETLSSDWHQYNAIFWMLCEYSSANYSGLRGVTGGGIFSRIWSGRWGTNHGNEVTQTLTQLQKLSGKEQTVANLLSSLKSNLKNKELCPNGDLSRILEVVKEKTGKTLRNCDAENSQINTHLKFN